MIADNKNKPHRKIEKKLCTYLVKTKTNVVQKNRK